MTRPVLWGIAFALFAIPSGRAQDVTFTKTRIAADADGKETPVTLTLGDAGLRIAGTASSRRRKPASRVDLEVPYASIAKISYGFVERRRAKEAAAAAPLIGVLSPALLLTKSRGHWLVVQGHTNSAPLAVLRLHKDEYRAAISAMNARSGKRVEVLEPTDTVLDPTAGSKDVDEVVPYSVDRVLAALRPAMEQHHCKPGKDRKGVLECSRGLRPPDGRGSGEKVTARVEPSGQGARVRIRTARGFGRDWSLPIYREMRKRLD